MGIKGSWLRRTGLLVCCWLLLVPSVALAQESPQSTEAPGELAADLTGSCEISGVESRRGWQHDLTDGRVNVK